MPVDLNPVQGLREGDLLRHDVWHWEIRLEMRLGTDYAILQNYRRSLNELRRGCAALSRVEAQSHPSKTWSRQVRSYLEAAYKAQVQLAQEASKLIGIDAGRHRVRAHLHPGDRTRSRRTAARGI